MCSETPCCTAFIFYGSIDIQPRITVNKYWHYNGTSLELKNVKLLDTYCIGRRISLCHEYKHGELRVIVCPVTLVPKLA